MGIDVCNYCLIYAAHSRMAAQKANVAVCLNRTIDYAGHPWFANRFALRSKCCIC